MKKAIGAILVVFLAVSCKSSSSGGKTYHVGVTQMSAHFSSTTTTDDRDVTFEVWYPALNPTGEAPMMYMGILNGQATQDSPPDASGAPYPLIVFSHGFGGDRFQSIFLTEGLAAAGFVVAAPDHQDADALLMPGTTFTLSDDFLYYARPEEISFVIDTMGRLIASDPILAGMAETTSVGVTGHSLGGYTTLMVSGAEIDLAGLQDECASATPVEGCVVAANLTSSTGWIARRDPRVVASVSLAPFSSVITPAGMKMLGIPHMTMGGSNDTLTPFDAEVKTVYDAISSPAYLLEIIGAGHFTFSDLACASLFSSSPDCQDGDRRRSIILEHEVAFFDHYLKGDLSTGSLLTDTTASDFTLTVK